MRARHTTRAISVVAAGKAPVFLITQAEECATSGHQMLEVSVTPEIVQLNEEYLPENEAKISIFDHEFVFADAVYDVTPRWSTEALDFEDTSLTPPKTCVCAVIRLFSIDLNASRALSTGTNHFASPSLQDADEE
jgi:hypothetical protein